MCVLFFFGDPSDVKDELFTSSKITVLDCFLLISAPHRGAMRLPKDIHFE